MLDRKPNLDPSNQQSDEIYHCVTIMSRKFPEGSASNEDQEVLDLARRLAQIDFSSESQVRQTLRQRLARQIRSQVVQSARSSQAVWYSVLFRLAFVICLALVVGFATREAIWQREALYQSPQASALASFEDHTITPHSSATSQGGGLTPRPIPTPQAPTELVFPSPSSDTPHESVIPNNLSSRSPQETPGTPLP